MAAGIYRSRNHRSRSRSHSRGRARASRYSRSRSPERSRSRRSREKSCKHFQNNFFIRNRPYPAKLIRQFMRLLILFENHIYASVTEQQPVSAYFSECTRKNDLKQPGFIGVVQTFSQKCNVQTVEPFSRWTVMCGLNVHMFLFKCIEAFTFMLTFLSECKFLNVFRDILPCYSLCSDCEFNCFNVNCLYLARSHPKLDFEFDVRLQTSSTFY